MTRQTAAERFIDTLRQHGYDVVEKPDGTARAVCPNHDDRRPSLDIKPAPGKVLIICRVYGAEATPDILAKLNMTKGDLFDNRKGIDHKYPRGLIVSRYYPRGANHKELAQKGNKADRSLYGSERITPDTKVILAVEGEQNVDDATLIGAVAVSAKMGATHADKSDWSACYGYPIKVVADKDDIGRRHAAQVIGILNGHVPELGVFEAADGCHDLSDHVAAGLGINDLVAVPAPEPVDGAELLDDLRAAFTKYVAFPDKHASAAVTLWDATTHVLPAFEFAPRRAINSPEKRCGKTRLLDIVAATCHKPLATADATVAAIFRSLGGAHPPTLIIDEIDALFGNKKIAEQNEELRKLLNAGHERGRPALRGVGPLQTPTEFPVFAMAALAGIGDMPDTITDRAVNIALQRRTPDERVSQFRARRDGPTLERLRDRLARWAADHIEKLTGSEPAMPVEDRAADTWEPLIAVADAAGGHWPDTARRACKALVAAAESVDEDQSLGVKLLADIRSVFDDRLASFIGSPDLVMALRRLEDSPWHDFEYTTRKLAYRLREFGVKPAHNSAKTVRGYRLEDLADAFRRYLRPDPSDRPEPQVGHGFSTDGSKATDDSIRPCEKIRPTEIPFQDLFSDGWTDPDEPGAGNEPTPRCACGNRLLTPEARARGTCKPCADASKKGPTKSGFEPPTGPVHRCLECHRDVDTQGHSPDCPSGKWKRP